MESHDLTTGILWKQILIFSVPIFLSSVLQQFYNMIDVWFLGNFVGTDAVAAAGGATGSFIALCISLFNGFSASVTIVIGHLFGSGKRDAIRNVIYNTVLLCMILGAVIGGVCIGITPTVLSACDVQEEIMGMAVSYLQIYFLGTIPMFIYNLTSGMLRAMGDSRTPLFVLGLGCVLNIIGDAFTMLVLSWGIEGAAVATIFAQTVSALVNLYLLLHRSKTETGLAGTKFRLDLHVMKRIICLGVPCGVQNMMYSFANLILQSAVNQFGTDAVAAMSIYSRADSICWWAVESFGVALTTVVAQNYGAGKNERVIKGTRLAIMFAILTEAVFSLLYLVGARWYFRFFTDNEEVIQIGIRIVYEIVPFFVTYSFIDTLAGTIKGLGKTVEPMVITFIGICLLRVAWVLAVRNLEGSFSQVLRNYPVTWITTSIMFLIYYAFFIKRKLQSGTVLQTESGGR